MSDPEIFRRLTQLLGEGKKAVLCTLVEKKGSGPRNIGAKMVIDPEGNTLGTIGGGEMERKLVFEALKTMKEDRPRAIDFTLGIEPKEGAVAIDSKCGGEVKVFMDIVEPIPRLVIIGSGYIAKPLAELADMVGFEVIVVDDAETATWERFPMAKEIHSGPFAEEIRLVKIGASDYVTIVHGETSYELETLRNILPKKPTYIGLLGSRNKASAHKRHLSEEGFNAMELEAIHAPIGVSIGAETPEEIAVSIIAELINLRRRKEPR